MLIAAAIDGVEKRVDVREDHRLRPTDELVVLQLGSERGGFGEIRARLTPVEGKGFETSPHRFSRTPLRHLEKWPLTSPQPLAPYGDTPLQDASPWPAHRYA